MSETDSFIDEVSEELRRDRLFILFRRYGWIAALVVVGLVGVTAWFEWMRAQTLAQAQARGDALLSALENGNLTDQPFSNDTEVAALFLAAQGDRAVEALRIIISDDRQPTYIRDLARLKLAMADGLIDRIEKRQILGFLSQPGGIYRPIARELFALVELQDGNRDVALDMLQAQIQDATTPPEQAQRLIELIVALGATPQLANSAEAVSEN